MNERELFTNFWVRESATTRRVLAHSAGMGERWRALRDERWAGAIDFGGRARPASAMAWSFLFDIVHHRGQITTYLRPMGSTVPQVHGPSADEP